MGIWKVLGWVFIPYVMIFIYWKGLKGGGKTIGVMWAVVMGLSFIANLSGGGSEQTSSVPVAQVEDSTDSNAKAEAEAAKEAKKKAEAAAKAAEEKRKAEEKAAEEAEYNKPENVYKRWVDSQFSPWDGSATALKESVKENMNNPKSFEHVETTYTDKGNMQGIDVYMKFRGTNGFGGVVTNTVHASYDYKSGTFTYEMID